MSSKKIGSLASMLSKFNPEGIIFAVEVLILSIILVVMGAVTIYVYNNSTDSDKKTRKNIQIARYIGAMMIGVGIGIMVKQISVTFHKIHFMSELYIIVLLAFLVGISIYMINRLDAITANSSSKTKVESIAYVSQTVCWGVIGFSIGIGIQLLLKLILNITSGRMKKGGSDVEKAAMQLKSLEQEASEIEYLLPVLGVINIVYAIIVGVAAGDLMYMHFNLKNKKNEAGLIASIIGLVFTLIFLVLGILCFVAMAFVG